jgi:NTP pyrophosphatase (non-canonical NTP hydrolase)
MNFKKYRKKVTESILPFINREDQAYLALGIAGEAGEVADEIKKFLRRHNSKHKPTGKAKKRLVLELGDLFYYIVRFMELNDIKSNEVFETHIKKLSQIKKKYKNKHRTR